MHPDKIPKLLYELIRNSRRSDRDLAKILRFSQPTVTRTRKTLEDEKYILQYTALPDFAKLGFEIVAFTFIEWLQEENERGEQHLKLLKRDPTVIFAARGHGLDGKNSMIITLHKNYTNYSNFVVDLRSRGLKTGAAQTMNSFIVPLTSIEKHLGLADLQKIKT